VAYLLLICPSYSNEYSNAALGEFRGSQQTVLAADEAIHGTLTGINNNKKWGHNKRSKWSLITLSASTCRTVLIFGWRRHPGVPQSRCGPLIRTRVTPPRCKIIGGSRAIHGVRAGFSSRQKVIYSLNYFRFFSFRKWSNNPQLMCVLGEGVTGMGELGSLTTWHLPGGRLVLRPGGPSRQVVK